MKSTQRSFLKVSAVVPLIRPSTLSAAHLMNLAYYHRQAMKWDPEKCEFIGGTGNVNWLIGSRRDYKKATV